MLEFSEIPVSIAPAQVLQQATELINQANAVQNRLFPGDRLAPDSIANDYGHWLLVLGFMKGIMVATMTCEMREGDVKIGLLSVAPDHQGHQLGAKMLRRADQIALEKGLPSLILEAVDRGGLVPYYIKHGFKENSREQRPIGSWGAPEPFDLVTLSRKCKTH